MRRRGIAFLNKPGRSREAAIAWDASSGGDYSYGFIAITDCSKRVSLDIDVSTKDEYENSLYKVDRLLQELMACRKALVAERKKREDVE